MIAKNIKWDTNGDKELLQDLPAAMTIPDNMTDDVICDWISDQTGFCHFGFELAPDIITIVDDGCHTVKIRIPADNHIPTITIGNDTYFEGQIPDKDLKKIMDYPFVAGGDPGYVGSVIYVHISDIIDRDYEQFLDYISIEMCGNDCLMDVNYRVVGVHETDPNTLLILVYGDVSEIIQ